MTVTLYNRLAQPIRPTVKDAETGETTELVIPANGASDPVEKSNLTPYTEQLARAGHILVRVVG